APAELGSLPAGGGGRRLAGAAFPAARSRALVAARTRPVVAAGPAGHGLPPERPRGPGLVRLGRAAPAERSRMGAGGPLRDRLRMGPGLGMDRQRLCPAGGLCAPPLPGLLTALVRRPARAQGCELGQRAADAPPALPQLLPGAAPGRDRGFSQ